MATDILKHVETLGARRKRKLARNIHETISTLDSELRMVVDAQYRERLVKATYALQNLQELIQRDKKLAKHSWNSEVRQRQPPV